MTFITVKEASEKWNISTRRICILCTEGRIKGAVKKSRVWMIPSNARKPEDGRKTEIDNKVLPILLLVNPTYFQQKNIEPNEIEKKICEIYETYLCGNIKDAYEELNFLMGKCKDKRYECVFLIIKMFICVDLGKQSEYCEGVQKIRHIVNGRDEFKIEKAIIALFFGRTEWKLGLPVNEELFDELVPLISMLIIKSKLNEVIKGKEKTDISHLEIICWELNGKDTPLISAYSHLYLATYYNIVSDKKLFEYHINYAMSILLPRKWYTPLAEYSATIDWDKIQGINGKERDIIKQLSKKIVENYVKSGIFAEISHKPKMEVDMNIQVGYMLVQGKSNDEISNELGISKYRVKQHIDDICSIFGANSKKEIREYVIKFLFV